jgi:hypothetical protein
MTVRARSVLAALASCLAISGTAIAADRPPDGERLAPAVTQAKRIAREVELRHRLPGGGRLAIVEVTTMLGVSTLETFDPSDWSGRSIETDNGIYVSLCGGGRRHCAMSELGGAGDAVVARRQAVELARRTLAETQLYLVVVALPQRSTRLLLVFERGRLDLSDQDTDVGVVDRLTRDRLYATAGLIPFSDTEDSLALVKLRARR